MFPETAVAFTERVLALPQPFRMGDIFALAKEHIDLPVGEVDAPARPPRPARGSRRRAERDGQAGAAASARRRHQRTALYDLYLRRHDRIDNWDLVDLGAPHVVGGYLVDKPREPLYALARSEEP